MTAADAGKTISSNVIPALRSFWGHDLVWWRELANTVMVWGLIIGVLGGAVVVVATQLVLRWDGEIKTHTDAEFAAYKLEVAGKVADANKAGIKAGEKAGLAQAGADDAHTKLKQAEARIAEADARAAEADARAAEAKLALEQFKAPRALTQDQLDRLTTAMRPYAGIPFDFSIEPNPETIALMTQIGGALQRAGLVWTAPSGTSIVFRQPGFPAAAQVAFSGLAVQYDTVKQADFELPARTIWHTLEGFGLKVAATRILDGSVTPTAIHLYIGEKPS